MADHDKARTMRGFGQHYFSRIDFSPDSESFRLDLAIFLRSKQSITDVPFRVTIFPEVKSAQIAGAQFKYKSLSLISESPALVFVQSSQLVTVSCA